MWSWLESIRCRELSRIKKESVQSLSFRVKYELFQTCSSAAFNRIKEFFQYSEMLICHRRRIFAVILPFLKKWEVSSPSITSFTCLLPLITIQTGIYFVKNIGTLLSSMLQCRWIWNLRKKNCLKYEFIFDVTLFFHLISNFFNFIVFYKNVLHLCWLINCFKRLSFVWLCPCFSAAKLLDQCYDKVHLNVFSKIYYEVSSGFAISNRYVRSLSQVTI